MCDKTPRHVLEALLEHSRGELRRERQQKVNAERTLCTLRHKIRDLQLTVEDVKIFPDVNMEKYVKQLENDIMNL